MVGGPVRIEELDVSKGDCGVETELPKPGFLIFSMSGRSVSEMYKSAC